MGILRPYGLLFVIAGISLLITGIVILLTNKFDWMGKLPGDIHITRDQFSFHFPIMTCLLISVVLTVIFYLVRIFFSIR